MAAGEGQSQHLALAGLFTEGGPLIRELNLSHWERL